IGDELFAGLVRAAKAELGFLHVHCLNASMVGQCEMLALKDRARPQTAGTTSDRVARLRI
ncbi:MAG TPA: hypothetical protein DDZ81_08230, partial [Acetobacteraceae bacterium]|nr:hypothetical protein [Acetobacteraceae bacterium]